MKKLFSSGHLFIALLLLLSVCFYISTCHYANKYEELLKAPPKVETKVVYVDREVEVPVEVIKEVPVYTEAEAMSEEDFFYLVQAIYEEAGAKKESDLNRTLTGNVVVNRRDCNYRGAKSIKEVLFTRGQYSTASDITDYEHKEVPLSSVLAAYRLAIGKRYCPNNVIFQSKSKQGDGVYLKEGSHYFCYDNLIPLNQFQEISVLE